MGIYNATESTEAATRDGVLSSYPNTTYDPASVASIDFDALWATALGTVQSSLTTAETNYETAVNNATTAYDTGMSNAAATYSSMVTTADQNRDGAYATADGTYNTNTSLDYADYNNAVYGPGGIEETWQGAIDSADAAYGSAVSIAMSAYDSAVQAAQATLDSDIAAAYQDNDDWLNGNQAGQSMTSSFERIETIDHSTTPPTVTWAASSRVEWSSTEGTGTYSEFVTKPRVPDGYVLISTVTATVGPVTTITETYDPPLGGLGTGLSPAIQQQHAAVLTPAHQNPWELARVARTEFYIAELNGYYDQYIIDMNVAQAAYDGAIVAANNGYNTTLYGDPTGATAAPGTPAESFNLAVTAASNAFSSGEQLANSTYNTNMDGYNQAEMQYMMDVMMGMPATPPNPNDPAQFAKDYFVDTTALDINHAFATGSAWTAWVSAQLAADTTRDDAIINAGHQLGVDQANAGNDLTNNQIGAEDSYAKDIIDINADYSIAVMTKSADVAGDNADAELAFELAEHGAAQTAGKAINLAGKDREHDYADADETRAEALSLEDEDLANDLAGEEETRQNSYATGNAGWLSAEAAAHIASTTIAALATDTFLTSLVAADVGYVTAAAPLITSATQAFNNAVDADYVAAFPGDTDLAAVSGEWTRYFNAMATAAQTAITNEATAFQTYINGMAGDIQTTMNDIASEATQLATDHGNALTTYVSTVAAAATLEVSQAVAAGVVWVDSVATHVKNAVQGAANAWLQLADDGVDAATVQADAYSNYWNGFVHSYLGALVPHETNLINEGRQATKDIDSELTTLASGVAAEQHDLTTDDLTEWQSAALLLSPLDDALVNAWANQESTLTTLYAWDNHSNTQATPVADFASAFPGGAAPIPGPGYTTISDYLDEFAAEQLAQSTGAQIASMPPPLATSGTGLVLPLDPELDSWAIDEARSQLIALAPNVEAFCTETCQTWSLEFENRANSMNHDAIVSADLHVYQLVPTEDTPYSAWPVLIGTSFGHAVIEVTFIDGSVSYFDNGAVGLGDHMFSADEFPDWMFRLPEKGAVTDNVKEIIEDEGFWQSHWVTPFVDFLSWFGANGGGNPAMGDFIPM